jgi:hypothetical protein
MTRTILLTLFLAACRCNPYPADPVTPTPAPDPTIPPIPWEDGGAPEPEPRNGCGEMCARLAELGCDAANPTPEGATCLDVCRNVVEQTTVRLNFDCIVASRTCSEAGDC